MKDLLIELNESGRQVLSLFMKIKAIDPRKMIIGGQQLGKEFNYSRARAHSILTSLENRTILEKIPRKGFILTDIGIEYLREFEHRLRILETYFHNELKMDIETAFNEALQLVMHVSYSFVKILCDKMDKPSTCPHNLEIPHQEKMSI